MKCIICGNDAVFVYKGNSLCEEHIPKEDKDRIETIERRDEFDYPIGEH